jgi:hypothetical protein
MRSCWLADTHVEPSRWVTSPSPNGESLAVASLDLIAGWATIAYLFFVSLRANSRWFGRKSHAKGAPEHLSGSTTRRCAYREWSSTIDST